MATDNGNFFADGLLKLFFAIFKAVGVRQVKAGLRPVTTFSAIETPTISVAGQQRNIKPTMSDADRLVFEVLSDPPESESIGENIFKANSSYTTSLPLTTTYAEDSNVTFTQDLKWLNLADSTSFSNRTTSEPQYPVIVAYHSASFTHVIIGISVGIATAVLIVAGFLIFWHLKKRRKKAGERVVAKTFRANVWDEVSLHQPINYVDFRKDSVDNLSTLDTDYYVKTLDTFGVPGSSAMSKPPNAARQPHNANSGANLITNFTSKL